MDSFPKLNPSQAGTEPAIEEIEDWDADELLEWIQQKKPKLLRDASLENFKAACIPGRVFLMKAGNVELFKTECSLPIRPSLPLAALPSMIAEKEQDTSMGKAYRALAFG